MNINLNPELKVKEPPKEMLSRTVLPDGRVKVRANFSSLNLINECQRKAHYILDRNLRSDNEGEALVFGKAVHKALEAWYRIPIQDRNYAISKSAWELLEVVSYDEDYSKLGPDDSVSQAVAEFLKEMKPLNALPDTDKRSKQNGLRILRHFLEHYQNDEYEVAKTAAGELLIEKDFSFTMHETDTYVVEYFGRIDLALRNTISGTTVGVDHKTTSRLDANFINRCKPNHQYTGYIAGLRSLGIDTEDFMIQGIQVEKKQRGVLRQMTKRTQDDYHELRLWTLAAVSSWLANETYPQNAPAACGNYQRTCQFYDVCQAPLAFKENLIKATWPEAAI